MATDHREPESMNKDIKQVPLAESSVSLKLSKIQRRCAELINDPQASELSLVDATGSHPEVDSYDPYDRG